MTVPESLYAVQIRLLMLLSPPRLFSKISKLDWYRKILHTWVDEYLDARSMRVLDVGCATGYLTRYVFSKGHQVTGVDVSRRMISRAKKENSTTAIDFKLCNEKELPFQKGSIDLVLSASVINITSNPAEFAEQVFRVCKRDGIVSFLYPVSGFTDADLHRSVRELGISGFSKAALMAWHRSAPKLLINEVEQLLLEAGFEQIKSKQFFQGMVVSVSAKKIG